MYYSIMWMNTSKSAVRAPKMTHFSCEKEHMKVFKVDAKNVFEYTWKYVVKDTYAFLYRNGEKKVQGIWSYTNTDV